MNEEFLRYVNSLNWISDFLSERTQCVVCGGSTSKPISVTSGVPQGSVLGPLLFLTYINDISDNLSSSCCLFADDCILYRNITDAEILQEDLNKFATWAKTWDMHFNIDKCVVRVTLKHNPFTTEYFLDNQKLSSATKARYLGVIFDNKLTFNQHMDSVCQKANQTLSFLRRNLYQCNRRVKLDAYKIYVELILNYAATVWSPHTQYCINKLERIQK